MNGFEAFWLLYPRKVGKLDAQKAYARALKLASADVILEGVERYKTHKPEYADWSHPATWLNKGRWMDEYEEKPAPVVKPDMRGHFPPCRTNTECLRKVLAS